MLKPLDLIHTDVTGPILPEAYPDKEIYLLGVVDDYTRYAFVYPMKSKNDVHLGLKVFFDSVERCLNQAIHPRFIRMDNGMEYKTKEVKEFLDKRNIVEDRSPPYTSQLNGVAVRFLQTIQNATRSILVDSGFLKRLWLFAARYLVMIYNMIPRENWNGQMPYYLVFDHHPTYKFLCRFGCLAYLTLPKKVGKFSDRAMRKFFLGLTNSGAILLDMVTGQIKTAANVHYVESQVYGNFYDPFENTKFCDPLHLKRSAYKWFEDEGDKTLKFVPSILKKPNLLKNE